MCTFNYEVYKKLSLVLLINFFLQSPAEGSSFYSEVFQEANEPEFVEEIKNVTVPSGREAVLSCVVSNLGKYKVGWIRAEDQTILTLDSKVVTHNNRVSVTFDGLNTWNLHLRQVRQSDRGCYMCQINTALMRKQFGCIDVHVSPNIIDEETSSDFTGREGDNGTLVCRATGHPPPKITWRREDGEKIILRKGFRDIYKGYDNITSETLTFIRLERRQMGTFLCIASNDVPPAVSKRITLDVNFSPLIKVPSQLQGAPLGSDVTLECIVEACPKAFSYWMKNRGEMLIDGLGIKNSSKYVIEERRVSYKVFMRLTIRNFSRKDIGIYNCLATNSIGKAEESIRVNEIKTSKSTTSVTDTNHILSTIQGFATSPMSTDGKISTHFHQKNPETQWNFGSKDVIAQLPGGDRKNFDVSRKISQNIPNNSLTPVPNPLHIFFIILFLAR